VNPQLAARVRKDENRSCDPAATVDTVPWHCAFLENHPLGEWSFDSSSWALEVQRYNEQPEEDGAKDATEYRGPRERFPCRLGNKPRGASCQHEHFTALPNAPHNPRAARNPWATSYCSNDGVPTVGLMRLLASRVEETYTGGSAMRARELANPESSKLSRVDHPLRSVSGFNVFLASVAHCNSVSVLPVGVTVFEGELADIAMVMVPSTFDNLVLR
jgi:hypothetical protein